jgi:NADPH-dependent ferric siderophore reductase
MANLIKKAFFQFIDKTLTQEGSVLEVRKWDPAFMYEIDLHLPETDMSKWKVIPRIKVKVSDYEYRDYSPCNWQTKSRTCTVFIETEHLGPGSVWAKSLNTGDAFLFAPANAAPLPPTAGKVLCIGDGSALGHFLALKQFENQDASLLNVIIYLNAEYQIPPYIMDAHPEFKFVSQSHKSNPVNLQQLAAMYNLSEFSSICIAGYIPMVQELRKSLKDDANIGAKIFANGFWR